MSNEEEKRCPLCAEEMDWTDQLLKKIVFLIDNNHGFRRQEIVFQNWLTMEATVKKFQQKFKKVKDDMVQWDYLHAQLLSHFRNASSIIGREELNGAVLLLGKTACDAKKQVKGGSIRLSVKQINHRIGIKPSIADCLEDEKGIYVFYTDE
ncbi:hypothetical protein L2E82_47433 [Cichorium intybus]|uniref:Uncharacterized protein n=1 Tax=Cichorium intybus TaxID=13427 RepID=A0ACB8YWP3_CICIN|nr:hypothetical protein L2E82_47433 [Cichorium intybus]